MKTDNTAPITSRRSFLQKTAMGAFSLPVLSSLAQAEELMKGKVVGPILGHIDASTICCFVRAPKEGTIGLELKNSSGKTIQQLTAKAVQDNDLCVQFTVTGLEANTEYHGKFLHEQGQPLFEGANFIVQTAASPEDNKPVILGMGSCISNDKFNDIWKQAKAQKIEGFCLLGDSPYIDSNKLEKNRQRRRDFWTTLPALKSLAREIPFWNTWDDHDFGKNDSDGLMPKKENIRKAFIEYNALANYGENNAGIYTSFRRGPLEVWLIDDRWFSQTEASWADPKQKTCIGKKQWEWLQQSLKASDAPFKLLCTGMVWYPKGNKEKDHWETYSAEREAIFQFIKKEKIAGVVLISGDIHVSRHHDYGKDRLGYPLHECVVSPMHSSVIKSLDVPHPAKVWSKPAPNVFMTVKADQKQAEFTWINMAGKKLYQFSLSAGELTQA